MQCDPNGLLPARCPLSSVSHLASEASQLDRTGKKAPGALSNIWGCHRDNT